MATPVRGRSQQPCYYFEVRVNWDKLSGIDQQLETFKAQVFVEATLVYPKEVRAEDEEDLMKSFERATIENSLAKPSDDGRPFAKRKEGTLKFKWLIHGEFSERLELRNFPFDSQDLSVLLRFGVFLELQVFRLVANGINEVAIYPYAGSSTSLCIHFFHVPTYINSCR